MNEKYVKKSLLGQGGRGTVWLVENQDAGMPAALKWYENGEKEAKREREILRRFGGKGVPYLIDYMENGQGAGIVMEYVEGKSLRTLLDERKIWSEKETAVLIMKTAGILASFHRQVPQIIYGDLKPENIMVTPEGEVYLIDFGSVLYKGERERRVFGTREYLPPSEEGGISAYRDTYGLGVILYEMLTGSVLSKGIADRKADISHLSPECRRIMQKAVKIHETEGYANGGEIYEDFKAYLEDLHKEKKERKRGMFQRKSKEKADYFISDLKRLVCTGYTRGVCLLLMGVAAAGIVWSGNEVKGAGMEEAAEERVTIERVVVRNYAESNTGKEEITEEESRKKAGTKTAGTKTTETKTTETKTTGAKTTETKTTEIKTTETKTTGTETTMAAAEESEETEILRDEYGRKLIVKTDRGMENPGR